MDDQESGERSVSVRGDVIGSLIITGDHNRVFTGDYELLRDAYLKHSEVFDGISGDLAGRGWLEKKIDDFIGKHRCGYFVIVAPGGMGKTAFLAWLVRRRKVVHHFSELAPGEVGRALKSLTAQIIPAYELDPYEARDVLPAAASRPDQFYDLLKQASARRGEDKAVVLVIDSLDEAGTPDGRNVLGLPKRLPEGVFIIASQRPIAVTLAVEYPTALERLPLHPKDPDNERDVGQYLDALAESLDMSGLPADQFKKIMWEKSGGLWIYLRFVSQEIRDKRRSAFNLQGLPAGLTEYYKAYWKEWRSKDPSLWYGVRLPLIGILAAAREPITAEQILQYLPPGAMGLEPLRAFLREQWGAFIAMTGPAERRTYWFNHATLREFFEGAPEDSQGEPDEFLDEVRRAVLRAHTTIADHCFAGWNGWASGLAGLRLTAIEDQNEAYALRHLVEHLLRASRVPELHNLLVLTRTEIEKKPVGRKGLRGFVDRLLGKSFASTTHHRLAWFCARTVNGSMEDFQSDVARAWQAADHAAEARSPGAIGLQCRYALLTASPKSISSQIPPILLTALVQNGVWRPLQALSYAIQDPDEQRRNLLLLELAPVLGASGLAEQGFAAVKRITRGVLQSNALGNLAPHVPESLWPAVLERAKLLVTVAPHRLTGMRAETDRDLRPVSRAEMRAEVLAGLAARVPGPLLHSLVEVARAVAPELDRVFAFAAVLAHAPQEQFATILGQARTAAASWADEFERSMAALKLAGVMSGEETLPAVDRAVQIASQLNDDVERGWLLQEATLLLARVEPEAALDRIGSLTAEASQMNLLMAVAPLCGERSARRLLDCALAITDPVLQARTLAAIARYLSPLLLTEALSAARLLPVVRYGLPLGVPRLQAMLGLAQRMPDAHRRTVLDEIIAILPELLPNALALNGMTEVRVFSQLADMGRSNEALAMLGDITRVDYRVVCWTELLPYLPEASRIAAIHDMLDLVHRIGDGDERTAAMARLCVCMGDARQALKLAIDSKAAATLYFVGRELARRGHPKEAISAVEALTERVYDRDLPTRSEGLVAIAPHVPWPMLRSLIDGLNKRPRETTTTRSVGKLLNHVPEAERSGLLAQTLSAISALEDGQTKLDAMVDLAPLLSNDAKQETLSKICPVDSKVKVQWLAVLAPHLAEHSIRQVLRAAQRGADPLWRLETLRILSERVPPAERRQVLADSLAAAWEIEDERVRDGKLVMTAAQILQATGMEGIAKCLRDTPRGFHEQGDALRTLATHLSEGWFTRVVQATRSWTVEREWSHALAQLSTALAEAGHPREALVLLRAITRRYSALRVKALTSAIPSLPEEERRAAILEGFKEVSFQNSTERPESLAVLVPFLENSSTEDVFSIWRDALHESADQTRPALVSDIGALAPAMARLGGTQAIREAIQAIEAIGQWFP